MRRKSIQSFMRGCPGSYAMHGMAACRKPPWYQDLSAHTTHTVRETQQRLRTHCSRIFTDDTTWKRTCTQLRPCKSSVRATAKSSVRSCALFCEEFGALFYVTVESSTKTTPLDRSCCISTEKADAVVCEALSQLGRAGTHEQHQNLVIVRLEIILEAREAHPSSRGSSVPSISCSCTVLGGFQCEISQ